MTQGGRRPLALPGGEQRSFLEDGDTVTLRARTARRRARCASAWAASAAPCCRPLDRPERPRQRSATPANSPSCIQAACRGARLVRAHSSSMSHFTASSRASISGVAVSAASSSR